PPRPAPPPPPGSSGPATGPATAAGSGSGAPVDPAGAHRGGGLLAKVSRSTERREAVDGRVFRLRQVGFARGWASLPAEGRPVPEEVVEHRRVDRGPLRLPRQLGVQPRSRQPAGNG